jgi:hypothetical protein
MMKLSLGVTVVIACLAASVAVAGPPRGLSSAGVARWNFEALLHDSFGNHMVCEKRDTLSFFANDCTPLSDWQPYFFEFSGARHSAYHLSKQKLRGANFGNYPEPIRIDGRLVACNRAETRFLITYEDAAGISLACLAKQP